MAMVESLKGGSLKADSFTADLEYKEDVLYIKNGSIKGPAYEVKISGDVSFRDNLVNIKGVYIPSVYGINNLIAMIPLIGTLASGGGKTGLIAASFTVKGDIDNSKISFNPLSILAPGFLKNIGS